MSKDSQVDNKKARQAKSKGQTPLTRENQNNTRNVKKQSNPPNDVWMIIIAIKKHQLRCFFR